MMSRPILATLVSTVLVTNALARADEMPRDGTTCIASGSCQMTGKVLDSMTQTPVVGAFVSVGELNERTTTISDASGRFILDGLTPGSWEVAVIADGYQPMVLRVNVAHNAPALIMEITRDTSDEGGEVVVITAAAPDLAEPPSYEIDSSELRVLPGSGNDALGALQSLPGVARVPFGLGGLVLRGSSPRDSRVYLDGVEVPLLFHFGGLASFMPSSMLDSMELIPGGFSARYGRAQGGIVDIRSRAGRPERWRVASEVSLLDASVRAEGPGIAGGAWSVGLRRSYVDAILAAAVPEDSSFDLTLAPRYYDGQLRYDLELPSSGGSRQRFSAMIFGSDDRLRFLNAGETDPMTGAKEDEDRFDYVSSFLRIALGWQRNQGDVAISVTPWVGVDKNSLRFNEEGITRTSAPMGGRADITRTFASGFVSGGLDIQGGRFSFDINNEPPPMPGTTDSGDPNDDPIARDGVVWYADTAFWTEALYRFADGKLGIKPGARVEHYGLTSEWVFDPRINISHELESWLTLEESLGIFHQPPIFADLDPIFGNRNLGGSYAVQASLGAKVEPTSNISASATGFYDELYDLPVDAVSQATSASEPGSALSGGVAAISREFTSQQFGTYSYQENLGHGRTYGVELMIEANGGAPDRAGGFMAWVSYTYSRSWRRDDPSRYIEYRPYVLDQPHVLTALGTLQLTDKWRLGTRLRYATGNPFTPVRGTYFDADEQEYRSLPGPLLSSRLPAFFQLDVRLDRRWKRSYGTIGLFLDVQNVSNRVNPEGVSYNFDFTQREYTRGLPIFPSIGVEYIQ